MSDEQDLDDESPEESERRKAAELARLNHERVVREVLGTAAGRQFAYWLINDVAQVLGDDFVADAADPHGRIDAFRAGRRAVGKTLINEANRVAPGWFALEHERREAERFEKTKK